MVKPSQRYYEILAYIFFGAATTVINILSYELFRKNLQINFIVSNSIAWIISVSFAYITNRKYVFLSDEITIKGIAKEFMSFVSCRLLSGGCDLAMMIVLVSMIRINDSASKIVSNIVVVAINYILSKLIIFRKRSA